MSKQMAAQEALERIQDGQDPESLVHILYFPGDMYPDEIQGLSSSLPPGSNLSGYTGRYYTLAELAGL